MKRVCACRRFRFHHSDGFSDDAEDFLREVASLFTYVCGNGFFVKGFLFVFIMKAFLPVTQP